MRLLDFIRKNLIVVLAVLIIVILLVIYGIREYRISNTVYESKINEEYEVIPKTYGINEYSKRNISDDTIIKIYFSDFKSLLYKDLNSAYLKLDEEYKNKYFPTFSSFEDYVVKNNYFNYKLTKYKIENRDGYLTYILYDEKDNVYVFKTDGVLQYTISFIDE